MKENISSRVLEKIRQEKIKPEPKWKFLLKDYFVWGSFAISVFVGGIAVGGSAYILANNDWDIYSKLGKSSSQYFLLSLPYFWLVALGIFSFLAFYNYRHTKSGYRTNPYLIISSSVVLSLSLGFLFYNIGLSEKLERDFYRTIPYYGRNTEYRMKVWNQPGEGLIAGTITQIADENNFELESFSGESWEVAGEDILWRPKTEQETGAKVKVIGEIKTEKDGEGDEEGEESKKTFVGKEVRPWVGGGQRGIMGEDDMSGLNEARKGRMK